MTTHDRDKIIAIAEEVKANNDMFGDFSVALYAIAFEAGRQAEREAIVKDLLPPIATPQTKAHYIANEIADALCKAIRARGNMK